MPKTALVISGGGCKGAFAVGVIKRLARDFPAIHFDVMVGTSTGSLIVPMASIGALALLETFYTTITTDKVITKGNIPDRILGDNSLFDVAPLASLIKQNYTDALCQQIFQSPTEVYIATTCLQTGEAVNFSTHPPPNVNDNIVQQLTNADQLRRAIMASACQPVFMPPIEIDKTVQPIRQYVDGGVREYAGIDLAIEAGAEEIYAILLTPASDPSEEKTFNDSFSILERTIDIFSAGVSKNDLRIPLLFNAGLRYMAEVQQNLLKAGIPQATIDACFTSELTNPFAGKQPRKIFVIRPLQNLDTSPGGLDFDPEKMKNMVALGEDRISNYMATRPPDGDGFV